MHRQSHGRSYYTGSDVWLYLKVNSCADLANSIATSLEMYWADYDDAFDHNRSGPIVLGDLSLLSSQMRANTIEDRKLYEILIGQEDERREAAKAFKHLGDGRVEIKMRQTQFVDCYKIQDSTGRTHLMLALGEQLEESEFFGLSIPDAHRLLERLQRAIDSPMPQALN